MAQVSSLADAVAAPERQGAPDAEFRAMQAQVVGTNINPTTLLATDYLNHFNEIIMLLEMVPDMPDILEECAAWQPKDYVAHFRDSCFSDRDLAIAAYAHVPAEWRGRFEDTVAQMDTLALDSISVLRELIAAGDGAAVRVRAVGASRALQRLSDAASAIIHGTEPALHQAEIDALLAG